MAVGVGPDAAARVGPLEKVVGCSWRRRQETGLGQGGPHLHWGPLLGVDRRVVEHTELVHDLKLWHLCERHTEIKVGHSQLFCTASSKLPGSLSERLAGCTVGNRVRSREHELSKHVVQVLVQASLAEHWVHTALLDL